MRSTPWMGSAATGRRRGDRRTWSVRTYLTVGVSVILVAFAAAASVLFVTTVHQAQGTVRATAAAQASVASDAIGRSVALAETTVAATAGNAAVAAVLQRPTSGCTLTFGLDPFTGSHLDLVQPDGQVVCSSHRLTGAPVRDAAAPWRSGLGTDRGPVVSHPYVDLLTGRTSIAIAMAVTGQLHALVGAVVAVLPVDRVTAALSATFGGPQHFQFAVFDGSDGTRLSVSQVSHAVARGGPALESAPFGPVAMLDASHTLPVLGWKVFAGIGAGTALASTRASMMQDLGLGVAALVLLVLLVAMAYRRIARPLVRLTDAVSRADHEAAAVFPDISGPSEVTRLAREFGLMIASRDTYERQLSHQALHDPMTGLPNRALLDDRLSHALRHSEVPESIAVLFLDVDRLKLVNDTLGHSAGDQVLITLAARLRDAIRPGDTLARFGGDEFVIVCEGLQRMDEAEHLADRLRAAVALPVEVVGTVVSLTTSIGIVFGKGGTTPEMLLREADAAMYEAKVLGRGRHQVFDHSLQARAEDRLGMDGDLRLALDRGELWIAYQPIVEMRSRRLAGVEALLRWDHPVRGPVPPSAFIPVAEESGLIVPLGQFVLDGACRQLSDWRADGVDLRLSVNISRRQLAHPDLLDHVSGALADSGLPPDRLCLDLTESALIADASRAHLVLDQFKHLGCDLSVDDFGTGYSSLAYIHRFPIDELKIDRSLVSDVSTGAGTSSLVAAIVSMAKTLSLRVVAEGVETLDQVAALEAIGCELVQGFYFARPERPQIIETAMWSEASAFARRPGGLVQLNR